jgi:two-component system, response regulator YesN
MYRVLLVDDETLTFIGMRKVFNWKELGFDIIAETTNPYEALDMITQQKPDVVFTDVRMPEISGLELIRRVREMGLDTEFVIVSGFAEFTYAQEALRQGAFDYCLKPIKIDRENLLLKRLAGHLQNKKLHRDFSTFEEIMEERVPIMQYLQTAGIQCSGKYFQAIITVYETPQEGQAPEIPDEKLVLQLSPRKYLFLVNVDVGIENAMNPSDNSSCTVGISQMAEGSVCLQDLYRQADQAAYGSFLSGGRGIFVYKNKNIPFVNKLVSKIVQNIENRNSQALKVIFEQLPDTFQENGLFIEDTVYLWNQIAAFTAGQFEDKDACKELVFIDYNELLERFAAMADLTGFLHALLQSLISVEDGKSGCSNENFMKMIDYVDQHYTERLFLKELTADFYINLNYCCELFKRVKGCTFSEYITGLRMKKAAELLKSSSMSIGEVAKTVGYDDYFYFNRVFSKHFNLSPAKYMKNQQRNG